MPDYEPLVQSYVHLSSFPRADEALHMLKRIASLVKPIMRARGWKVRELAEFYPQQQNLLGLNVNRGAKICIRLRYPGDRTQFFPLENAVDTMLHELSHIVHGPHNSEFHALWDQLRDECQGLVMKGYTGEGFLSEGRRLGGHPGSKRIPPHEARRLAREAAEKRRTQPLGSGPGRRLGGSAARPDRDIRQVIADAADRRGKTLKGCGTDRLSDRQIHDIAETATQNGFRTQAAEDEANEVAIAQALWELVQEEDLSKKGRSHANDGGDRTQGGGEAAPAPSLWSCSICTLQNPPEFLCCDACGAERTHESGSKGKERQSAPVPPPPTIDLTNSPPRKRSRGNVPTAEGCMTRPKDLQQSDASLFWQCSHCGMVMERCWWTCSVCGQVKENSR